MASIEAIDDSGRDDWRQTFDQLVGSGAMRCHWLRDWIAYLEPSDNPDNGSRDFCPPTAHSLDLTTYYNYRKMLYGEGGE